MEIHYPVDARPATPEYVLAVLRDLHRHQVCYDDAADGSIDLTFDSTVADWRIACDLVPWMQLGHAMNEYWGIQCSDHIWRAVLEPASLTTLKAVCELIAANVTAIQFRPAQFFGKDCAASGIFLTLRSMLHHEGIDVRGLRPSSAIAPFARRFGAFFIGNISLMSPGALPTVRVQNPLYDLAVNSLLLGLLALVVGGCVGSPYATILAVVLICGGHIGTWATANHPWRVEFHGIDIFRDLAKSIERNAAAVDCLLATSAHGSQTVKDSN